MAPGQLGLRADVLEDPDGLLDGVLRAYRIRWIQTDQSLSQRAVSNALRPLIAGFFRQPDRVLTHARHRAVVAERQKGVSQEGPLPRQDELGAETFGDDPGLLEKHSAPSRISSHG